MKQGKDLLAAKIPGSETGIEVRQTICDICCPSFHCGVDAYVKDGTVIKIEGTAEHPLNHGLLCAKGLSNRQYLYREDRIRTPLRRVGERGEGKFEPITWEEAYEEIARRLLGVRQAHGAESTVFFSGYSKWYRPWLHRLCHSFGSLNYITESSSCMTSTFLQWLTVAGCQMCTPDTAKAGVYLGWAFNPYHSRHLAAPLVEKRKAEGMKVIIIDPRVTPASLHLADLHLRPRAGTDGALALGLAHLLIAAGKVDGAYIERYVHGYDEFARYVADFTPAAVEKLTGVPAAQLEEAAALIGGNLPLAISESAAPIAHHENGFQSYRAIMALSAITGSFDRPGGQLPVEFTYNYQAAGFTTREAEFIDATRPQNARPAVGAERFPLWGEYIHEGQMNDLARQIRTGAPYPIKALVGFGMNYRIAPDSEGLRKALLELDFLVNTDLFLTDSCKLCDIVLPACTSFERSELKVWGGGYMTCTTPVIPPLYEAKPDVEIICGLARAMQLGDPLLEAGVEACYRFLLEGVPVTLEELRANPYPVKVPGARPLTAGALLEHGFSTRSGKFELYSLAIEQYRDKGLQPLPVYLPPMADQSEEDYPFRLCSSPRIPGALHSRLHNVPWNRSLRPEPLADLNPADGAALGIEQGDRVEVYSDKGAITLKANLTAKVDAGAVYVFHGYAEADVNSILDADRLDPYSGFPAYRSCRVGVRKKV